MFIQFIFVLDRQYRSSTYCEYVPNVADLIIYDLFNYFSYMFSSSIPYHIIHKYYFCLNFFHFCLYISTCSTSVKYNLTENRECPQVTQTSWKKPRFYWSCSWMVMKDATPLTPLEHERNSISKSKRIQSMIHKAHKI